MYAEGDEDSNMFSYIRLRVKPCSSTDVDCLFYYLSSTSGSEMFNKLATAKAISIHGDTTTFAGAVTDCDDMSISNKCKSATNSLTDYIEERLESIYLTFNYVEAVARVEIYDSPFKFNTNSGIKTTISVNNQKDVNVFFKTSTVETDVGVFIESFKRESSFAFDSVSIDIKDRGFGKQNNEKGTDGTVSAETTSYIEFNIFSSNKEIIYTRKYVKIIDVLSDVGGIAEVIAFFSIFIYAWYNSIKMEQKLLNYGVLNK
jgi:hypothetical protein